MNRESEPPGATKASERIENAARASASLRHDLGQRLDAAVDATFDAEQITWLENLVNLPSFSRSPEDVEKAALFVEASCRELGLEVERVEVSSREFASHRVYSTPGVRHSQQALALVGHVDTVFPRSLGFLAMRREDDAAKPGDKIFGPGVLDMKSGLSAIVFALKAWRAVDPQGWNRCPVRFVCNTDEEVGSPSSAALFERLAPSTWAALIFEAGRVADKIVTRRKGGASFTIQAIGKAAHSGNDHAAGVSAIHALCLLIPQIEALTDYSRNLTINVGTITGGTSRNTVPESAQCEIDARFATKSDADGLVAAIEELVREPFKGYSVPDKLHEVKFELKSRIGRPPMEAIAGTSQLVRAYASCASAVGLGSQEAGLQGGGSDANLLAAAGVPSIDGLGPFGQYFHQTQEWSSLASLRARTKALARFLAACASQD
jgi:glutamate carboxypeptidase